MEYRAPPQGTVSCIEAFLVQVISHFLTSRVTNYMIDERSEIDKQESKYIVAKQSIKLLILELQRSNFLDEISFSDSFY